jgi:hypothetical protein
LVSNLESQRSVQLVMALGGNVAVLVALAAAAGGAEHDIP